MALFSPSHLSASLLPSVCLCYSHLVSLLPEPASYLESTADLLTSQIHSHLERYNEHTTCMCIQCTYYMYVYTMNILHVCVYNEHTTCMCIQCTYYMYVYTMYILYYVYTMYILYYVYTMYILHVHVCVYNEHIILCVYNVHANNVYI